MLSGFYWDSHLLHVMRSWLIYYNNTQSKQYLVGYSSTYARADNCAGTTS